MINLRFVNVVWGAAYTENFLRVCLPSTLSPGNLEFLAAHGRPTYRIYTTAKDAEMMARAPAFLRLRELMPVELMRLDGVLPEDDPRSNQSSLAKYQVMSQCHTHFIKTLGSDEDAMVFLSPDLFWSDGSLRRLFEIAQSGKRLIMMCALRLAKESFVAALIARGAKDGKLAAISPRELVALALQHLHPATQSLVWGTAVSNDWPSLLLWKTRRDGLLLRAFHLHPLMVRPSRRDVYPAVTIDDDYIDAVCPNLDEEYIVTDSDDMVAFELSRRSASIGTVSATPANATNVAAWARSYANPKHRKFVQHRIRLHTGEIAGDWADAERRSDAAVNMICELLARSEVEVGT